MTGAAARLRRAAVLACLIAALPVTHLYAGPQQDYILYCMGCHGPQAEGVPGKVPPLAHSLGRFMRSPEGRNYVLRVPGAANSALSDAQLAEVLNWVAQKFDAAELARGAAPFTAEEVARLRHNPLTSVLATRSAVVRQLSSTGSAPPDQY